MSVEDIRNHWEWDRNLTRVSGFGYLPEKVNKELDDVTEVKSKFRTKLLQTLYCFEL